MASYSPSRSPVHTEVIMRRRPVFPSGPIVLVLIGLLVTSDADAQARWRTGNEFLAHGVGVTAAESTSLTRGETIARILRTADGRDVAVFGAVQVNVPRSFFLDRQRDLPRALRSPTRTQVHLFSQPASVNDVGAVAVSDDDVKELRDCKPNDCNFKLPATDMERLHTTVDLSAPDATARVATYARQRMVEYVNEYRAHGNAAMVVYGDRGSVRSSDAFAAMLRDSSYAFSAVPSLGQHLLEYPGHTLTGGTDVVFWSRDEMPNLRPVLRITHEFIYSPTDVPDVTLVAAKQIYGNHYFEAGLEVLAAVERATASGAPGITLVAVRRYRFDHLPSGGVLNVKSRVTNGLRDNVATDLKRLKQESEAAWSARAKTN
jgi:hypothetical protein